MDHINNITADDIANDNSQEIQLLKTSVEKIDHEIDKIYEALNELHEQYHSLRSYILPFEEEKEKNDSI